MSTTTDTITQIALENLRPRPFNPRPAWLKAALAKGTTLASLAVQGKAKAAPAKAGLKVKHDAGAAGETLRDPNTVDMFEAAHA